MEVKVDPGSETNCIPLSYFRRLFPQLCSKDGSPKENALEPTLAQFEAYDGGIMTSHGWIILPTQDIRGQQQVSSCEILCGDQGGSQDPDQSCNCNLAGTREGSMSKQGAQNQKASSICFLRRPRSHQIQITAILFHKPGSIKISSVEGPS